MAAAVTRFDYYNGAAPVFTGASFAGVTAESGFKFNAADTLSGTAAVAIPTATGTNFSWPKSMALDVTTVGTTNISNRRVYLNSAPATGLNVFYKSVATGSYAQSAAAASTATGSNGSTPTGYTVCAQSLGAAAAYDNSSVSTATLGVSGTLAVLAAAVDFLFVGGASNATAMPDIKLTYDEA